MRKCGQREKRCFNNAVEDSQKKSWIKKPQTEPTWCKQGAFTPNGITLRHPLTVVVVVPLVVFQNQFVCWTFTATCRHMSIPLIITFITLWKWCVNRDSRKVTVRSAGDFGVRWNLSPGLCQRIERKTDFRCISGWTAAAVCRRSSSPRLQFLGSWWYDSTEIQRGTGQCLNRKKRICSCLSHLLSWGERRSRIFMQFSDLMTFKICQVRRSQIYSAISWEFMRKHLKPGDDDEAGTGREGEEEMGPVPLHWPLLGKVIKEHAWMATLARCTRNKRALSLNRVLRLQKKSKSTLICCVKNNFQICVQIISL